jgi:hypothetical protein
METQKRTIKIHQKNICESNPIHAAIAELLPKVDGIVNTLHTNK